MRREEICKRMIVKVHESKEGSVVCVVDKELVGKNFEDDDLQLDLSSDYYKGSEMTSEEVGDLMRNAYGVNIVGEKSIRLAIDEGIIEKERRARSARGKDDGREEKNIEASCRDTKRRGCELVSPGEIENP